MVSGDAIAQRTKATINNEQIEHFRCLVLLMQGFCISRPLWKAEKSVVDFSFFLFSSTLPRQPQDPFSLNIACI